MSYVLAFLGIAALIFVHEFGHFVAAKAVGMRVERFSLFFGPMIFKFRAGETEYGVGSIPLGGYAKISGMNPEEELPPDVAPRAYCNQPVWKRIVVVAGRPGRQSGRRVRDRLADPRARRSVRRTTSTTSRS